MKIYLIKSRWTEAGVTNDNPDCFIKAETQREADRVFRKGFTSQNPLTVVSVEELTWEMFQTLTPSGFMIVPNVEF